MTPHFGVAQEDALLLLAHEKHGNKWIEIAKMVGGRSVPPNPLIPGVPQDSECTFEQSHSSLSQAERAEPVLNSVTECIVCVLQCSARHC